MRNDSRFEHFQDLKFCELFPTMGLKSRLHGFAVVISNHVRGRAEPKVLVFKNNAADKKFCCTTQKSGRTSLLC